MSSLLEFLQKERKLNWKFWFKYYHQHLLEFIYSKKIKPDDSWKGIKLKSTVIPQGWSSENAFEFLGKEYNGIMFKRFKD